MIAKIPSFLGEETKDYYGKIDMPALRYEPPLLDTAKFGSAVFFANVGLPFLVVSRTHAVCHKPGSR